MKVSYYPGCSLEGTARDYEESIQAVCKTLDVELQELEDWNCCGSTAAHSLDHRASIALPARNIAIAGEAGLEDVVVPCPLCFNRLKASEKALLGDEEIPVEGKPKIWDLANFVAQDHILDLIEPKVTSPLKGFKAVCYYGCMSSRPPKITDAEDPENPMSMDRILARLGIKTIDWSYKTDCCGASHVIARQDVVFRLVGKLYQKALEAGANCIVVSCQMCQANLDMYQDKIGKELGTELYLPIIYFTELIGLAMGDRGVDTWLSRHFVDPRELVKRLEAERLEAEKLEAEKLAKKEKAKKAKSQ